MSLIQVSQLDFAAHRFLIFDQPHFKDAITFLLLNDKTDQERNDLELKKLISSQFSHESDMREFVVDLYDKVSCNLLVSFSKSLS